MHDKPDLQSETMMASLQANYGLGVRELEFLPIDARDNASATQMSMKL